MNDTHYFWELWTGYYKHTTPTSLASNSEIHADFITKINKHGCEKKKNFLSLYNILVMKHFKNNVSKHTFHNLSKVIWICGQILVAYQGKYQCSFSTVLFLFINNFLPNLRPMMFLLVVLPPCALCNPSIAWSRVWCFRYASLSLVAKNYFPPIRSKHAPSATRALSGAEFGASGMPHSHWPLKIYIHH